jgi:ABC-type dipeptide/oligopeptide/nickel transport system ATPase component
VASEHTAQARELLARLGLDADSMDQGTGSLSAADVRLVDAARALARHPRVVVYQTPPGFDPDADPIWAVLTDLRETASTALVLIGGGLPAQLDPGSRVLVMCGGRVVEVLRSGDLTHPLHPYTLTLGEGSVGTPADSDATRSTLRNPRARDADEACPFQGGCPRAKARCATELPRLARPLGATHEVACHFPEDPRRPTRAAAVGETAQTLDGGAPGEGQAGSDEPTAREFADG